MVNRLAFHVISRLAKAYHHRKATDMPIRKRYSLHLRPFSLEKGEPYTLLMYIAYIHGVYHFRIKRARISLTGSGEVDNTLGSLQGCPVTMIACRTLEWPDLGNWGARS